MRQRKNKNKQPVPIPLDLTRIIAESERPENLTPHEERKHIFKLKTEIIEFENHNYQFVIFYHRDKVWWQTGDNSMLIYFYFLSKQMGLKNLRIRHDNDFTEKRWKHGYIGTSKINKIVSNLQALGYDMMADTPEIKIFALEAPIPKVDMEVWQNAEEEKEKRFNSLVVPHNIYPKVLSLSGILHREIVNKAANLSPARQRYYADMGADLSMWLSYKAIVMANGRMTAEEYFEGALERLDELNDWLAFVKKFDMFSVDTDLRILQEINDLKREVKVELGVIKKSKRQKATH